MVANFASAPTAVPSGMVEPVIVSPFVGTETESTVVLAVDAKRPGKRGPKVVRSEGTVKEVKTARECWARGHEVTDVSGHMAQGRRVAYIGEWLPHGRCGAPRGGRASEWGLRRCVAAPISWKASPLGGGDE